MGRFTSEGRSEGRSKGRRKEHTSGTGRTNGTRNRRRGPPQAAYAKRGENRKGFHFLVETLTLSMKDLMARFLGSYINRWTAWITRRSQFISRCHIVAGRRLSIGRRNLSSVEKFTSGVKIRGSGV